jgi:HEAT repeat protein
LGEPALGEPKDSRAVEPLIAALKDTDSGVRRNAASALGGRRDSRVVEPLIIALKDTDSGVRRNAASVLGQAKDPRAFSAFLAALKGVDTEVFAIAYISLIRWGEPGSEDALAETLNRFGNTEMAQALLNSGNSRLEQAAREWAGRYGIPIKTTYSGNFVRWGSQR